MYTVKHHMISYSFSDVRFMVNKVHDDKVLNSPYSSVDY